MQTYIKQMSYKKNQRITTYFNRILACLATIWRTIQSAIHKTILAFKD